jgi:hypothetical protein
MQLQKAATVATPARVSPLDNSAPLHAPTYGISTRKYMIVGHFEARDGVCSDQGRAPHLHLTLCRPRCLRPAWRLELSTVVRSR